MIPYQRQRLIRAPSRKGSRLRFLRRDVDFKAVTQTNQKTSAEALGRVFFSPLQPNYPGISLTGDRVSMVGRAWHVLPGPVRFRRPLKILGSE